MSPLMTFYALAMVGTLAVCGLGAWLRPRSMEVLAAAIYVAFASYLVQIGVSIHNLLGGNLLPPDSYVADPAVAGFSFFLCIISWARHKAQWKAMLSLCFGVELCFHTAFWGSRDDSVRSLYYYVASTNGVHLFVLGTLVIAGGRDVIGGLIELRDRARHSGFRAALRHGH